MAKQYYAVNYTNEDVLEALSGDDWTITPSAMITHGEPNSYELRATPDAPTHVTLYPGTAGPPMFDMRHASEDDYDLIDQFDAIGENDYFATLDFSTTVKVRLTNIVYDTTDDEGVDQIDTIDPADLPTEAELTIEVDDPYADDPEYVGERAAEELEGDWLITGYDVEILEDEEEAA